jgi:hypothetical protein
MILSPLPSHQRKRHFHLFHGELIEEDDHDEEEEEYVDHDDDSEVKAETESETKES